jgi:hypothetical protein
LQIGLIPVASPPLQQVYWFEEDATTTCIHCHISNIIIELLLRFEVSADGQVNFYPVSLTGYPVKDVNQY